EAAASSVTRMLHGDVRHTHRAKSIGPREAKLAWKLDLGAGIEAQIVSSPDESALYVPTLDGHLWAIDRAGKKKWSVDLGDRAYATPLVVEDGTIYAGSDAKKLIALTPEGIVRWRLEVDGEIDTGIMQAQDGTIVLACGSDVMGVRKGGDVVWRFSAK